MMLLAASGCAAAGDQPFDAPDTGLFQEFLADGKFDEAGHPLNARTTEAEAICSGAGRRRAHSFESVGARDGQGEICRGEVEGSVQQGELILNARLRATPADGDGELATVEVRAGDAVLGSTTLTKDALPRAGRWMNLAVPFTQSDGAPVTVVVRTAGQGRVELDYFELFPAAFQLALSPGSGEFGAGEELVIEAGLSASTPSLIANGMDLSARLKSLARLETTGFRRLWRVSVDDLLAGLDGTVDVRVRAGIHAARLQVRRAPPDCAFEGDPAGVKVLLTGFQPFPADASHENISWVAVSALSPDALPGVQVMRLELPVEYDRAAAEVTSAIERCAPELAISFGQGSDGIRLEQTAYNLEDTSEVAGGVPDNRGIIAAAIPILAGGPATRATRLPLDAIAAALDGAGEPSVRSDDPGRYICNNVFYAETGTALRSAGFVHLPYETDFPPDSRARWGHVAETIVRAAATR
jgi:pyroglutamyl-peptidase